MDKPNVIILALKYIFRTIVVAAIAVAIAAGSFQGVAYYLNGSFYSWEEVGKRFSETDATFNNSTEAGEQTVTTKLDQTNTEITMFVLQGNNSYNQYIALNMRNTKTNMVDVVLVPLHAEFTVSKKLLKEIQKEDKDAENPVSLTDISRIYADKSCDMIQKIIEDSLELKISGYDYITEPNFKALMKLAGKVNYNLSDVVTYRNGKNELKFIEKGYSDISPGQALVILKYEDGTDSQESDRLERVSNYLSTALPRLIKKNKAAKLAESYEKLVVTGGGRDLSKLKDVFGDLTTDSFIIRILQGSESDGVFTIDSQKASLQLSALIQQASSTSAKSDKKNSDTDDDSDNDRSDSDSDSKDLSIELFNAAYVEGIAGRWEGYLTSEGYSISMLSNYNDGPLSQTRIIVTEEGMGEDLLKYFPDAEISVENIDTGGDIRVYIGTDSTDVPEYDGSSHDDESDYDDFNSDDN